MEKSADDVLNTVPDALKRLAHTGTPDQWSAAFTANPDAMHRLLADYIKQAFAVPGKVGQRPMPREEQVDLRVLLFGEVTDEPISVALPALLRGTSERTFVTRIPMSRTQFQRLLAGQYQPTVTKLAAIAQACGVPPVYFREYRHAMVTAAFIQLISERPGIATDLYRRYLQVSPPKRRRTP